MKDTPRILLERLFNAGVAEVLGARAVAEVFEAGAIEKPDAVLAIGKAAYSMYEGLPEDIRRNTPALIVTKHGHTPPSHQPAAHIQVLESSHPNPSEASLEAGRLALEFVRNCAPDGWLLFLVSGGASSLAEVLEEGCSFGDLAELTRESLSDGSDIGTINRRRAAISKIKAGGLLSHFAGESATTLAISDVAGDDISVIGSGVGAYKSGDFEYSHQIIASNELARQAVAEQAARESLPVIANEENLYGDIEKVAQKIFGICDDGPGGLYIFGGEPTVVLPDNPGMGGRNQSLALLLARYFQGRTDLTALVAGTDGTDGVTDAAGGVVDGDSYLKLPGADDALARADAGTFLRNTGDQLVTGPTGTNVMDLLLILKGDG